MRARHLAPLLGAALLLGGCTSTEPGMEQVEMTLPTQAEADAAAARRISKQNADAELEKLAAEIENESGPK